MRSLTALVVTSVMLTACSSFMDDDTAIQTVDAPPFKQHQPLGSDEVLSRFSALPARSLAEGTCGLFLWLRRDDAPLLFFQRSDTGAADMIFDASERTLERKTAETAIAFNFFEEQVFDAPNYQVVVKVQAETVRSIRQGIKIDSGTLSIRLADGWSASLPVGGVIGCQNPS